MADVLARSDSISGDTYTAFVDQGKFGGKEVLALNKAVTAKPSAKATGVNSVGGESVVGSERSDIVVNEQQAEALATISDDNLQSAVDYYNSNGGNIPFNILGTNTGSSVYKGLEAAGLINQDGTVNATALVNEHNRRNGRQNSVDNSVNGLNKNTEAGLEDKSAISMPEASENDNRSSEKASKKYLSDTLQITPEQEQILKDFGKANGLKVEFVDGLVDGKGYGVYDGGNTIIISRYSKKPMAALFKHEFVHSVEKSKLYKKFQKYVLEESPAFKEWLSKKGFDKWTTAVNNMMAKYNEFGVEYKDPYAKAKADVVADFIGDYLFGEGDVEITADFLSELKKNNRSLCERFVDWCRSIIKRLKTHGVVDKDIIKLEQMLKRVKETTNREYTVTLTERKNSNQYLFASEKAKEAVAQFAKNPDADVRYSIPSERYADYDKPITLKDIEVLRSIGRQSVNEFQPADLEKAQKWAYKFYQQLGEKSPFFRAWFGDWRAYDTSAANVVSFAYGENPKLNYSKRFIDCKELNAKILVDETIINDSISYAKKNGDEKQIRKLLGKVDEILSNGILLDTRISERNSGNKKGSTQFMHYLYTPISINGAPFIAKLSIEEYDLTGKNRAYNLQRIELSEVSRAQYSQLIAENREKYAYTSDALSVAQLFDFVKQKDKNFTPKSVDEHLLNKDGTPKKFYHQTENTFTKFDIRHKGAGTSDLETPFGIFLKESDRDIGLKGKIQMQLYARMVSPLIVKNRTELVKKISEFSAEYAEIYNMSKEIDREYSKKHEEAIKAFNDFIIQNSHSPNRKSRQELYEDPEFIKVFEAEDNIVDEWQEINRENDLKAKEALTKTLRDNDFDGVILENDVGSFGRSTEAYIVLDNTQVKSAEEGTPNANIGTFDKTEGDIRYSIPTNAIGKSREELKAMVESGEITLDEAFESLTDQYGTMPKGENHSWYSKRF